MKKDTKNSRPVSPLENGDDSPTSPHASIAVKGNIKKTSTSIDYTSYLLLGLVIFITFYTYPKDWGKSPVAGLPHKSSVSLQHVWFYGWFTAISTGLGVLPFYFVSQFNKFWVGVSNAIAAGMMLAAACSLSFEGSQFSEVGPMLADISSSPFAALATYSALTRTAVGFTFGIAFILGTKKILDQYEHLKLGDIEGVSAQKMVLIVFVMTLHSLTEGIGIGVSFGGESGKNLGQFISLSLAVHNIPEGLAVALVLTSRRVSRIRSGLWAIFTSLPQPLMAIPAFIFVEKFIPMLPIGLGFAGGAMAYVAVFELVPEAIEDTNISITTIVGMISFVAMWFAQELVEMATHTHSPPNQ